MPARTKYDLPARYKYLLGGSELYLNLKEASSLYQFINRQGGKLQRKYSDTGCYVSLVKDIDLSKQKEVISVDQLLELLQKSQGRVAVSISISIHNR